MKSDTKVKIIGGFLFIVLIALYIAAIKFLPNRKSREELFYEQLERIECKIDSLNNKKDSIRIIIDSTHVKIIENETYYTERINTIVHQSYSADSSFVIDYIRQYSDKNPMSNTK